MNTLLNFLRTRRTVRTFRPEPISSEIIAEMLRVAVLAPSAHNLQPWRFVLLESEASRRRLAEALVTALRRDMQAQGAPESAIEARVSRSRRRLMEVPLAILLCRDRAARRAETQEEEIMGIQSVAAAGLQLLLAAHAFGLGGNWICWPLYAPAETCQALDLPTDWQPEALFFFGYPAETPVMPERIPIVLQR